MSVDDGHGTTWSCPLWIGDGVAAARALLAVAPRRRAWVMRRMFAEASAGCAHVARVGRPHPIWGNGSLMAVAMRRPIRPEPDLGDPDFRACLMAVLRQMDRRGRIGAFTLEHRTYLI